MNRWRDTCLFHKWITFECKAIFHTYFQPKISLCCDGKGVDTNDLFFRQIYIFYGTRSNAEFVIHNGFFFQDNAHDRVKIKLGVSKSERLYAMKAEVLARAGIPAYVSQTPLLHVSELCVSRLAAVCTSSLIWVKDSLRLTTNFMRPSHSHTQFCLPTVVISAN